MKKWFSVLVFFYTISLFAQNFYDSGSIRNINIQFKTPKWDKILDSLMTDGQGKRLSATVSIDGKSYSKVGVRYKGNSSYNNVRNQQKVKLPLNLESDNEIKNQHFSDDVSSIKLSNMFRDPSYIREVLAYWLANQLMPSPKANFAKVTVNKSYLGIYTNTESLDDRFLKMNFGTSKGVFIKCDPNWDSPELSDCPKGDKAALLWQGNDSSCYMGNYELKSKKGYHELINLIGVLNNSPEKIDKVLDVDKTLWMHAFNHTIVNLDSYSGRLSHNYYLYKDTTGVFVPLVWDMNLAFGGFRMDYKKVLTDEEISNYSILSHSDDPLRPLISKLLQNPLYKKIYLAHCNYIYENFFKNGKLEKQADVISKFIEPEVKKDISNLYTFNEFKQNLERKVLLGNVPVTGLKELINARKSYLQSFFKDYNENGAQIDTVYHVKDSTGYYVKVKTNSTKAYIFYRNQQQPKFFCVQMLEDMEKRDSNGSRYFYYLLPAIDKSQYYVVAESEKNAQVLPARASNYPFSIPNKK